MNEGGLLLLCTADAIQDHPVWAWILRRCGSRMFSVLLSKMSAFHIRPKSRKSLVYFDGSGMDRHGHLGHTHLRQLPFESLY